jgi:hypothetical protein
MEQSTQHDPGQVWHHILQKIAEFESRLAENAASASASVSSSPAPRPGTLRRRAPVFHGIPNSQENPLDFVSQLRLALELEHIPIAEWGRHFSASLAGLAHSWFQQWKRTSGYDDAHHPDWDDAVAAFRSQYCPPTRITDLRNALDRLRYAGRISNLRAQFEVLSSQIPESEMTIQDRIRLL